MDFGKLGGLGDMLGKAMGKNVASSLPLDKILQGVLNKLGIKMDPAKVKALVESPAVQQLVNKAIDAVMNSKASGKDVSTAADSSLGKIADKILTNAPNTKVSKTDIVSTLKDELLKKLG